MLYIKCKLETCKYFVLDSAIKIILPILLTLTAIVLVFLAVIIIAVFAIRTYKGELFHHIYHT